MTDKPTATEGSGAAMNTDRELWREREGDYYADSIHVTEGGGIGINCGGYVIVKPIRGWFRLAAAKETLPSPQPSALSENALTAVIERLPRIVPSELEPGEQSIHNGEYVSLYLVKEALKSAAPQEPRLDDNRRGTTPMTGSRPAAAAPSEERLRELLETVRYSDFPTYSDEAIEEIVGMLSKSTAPHPCERCAELERRAIAAEAIVRANAAPPVPFKGAKVHFCELSQTEPAAAAPCTEWCGLDACTNYNGDMVCRGLKSAAPQEARGGAGESTVAVSTPAAAAPNRRTMMTCPQCGWRAAVPDGWLQSATSAAPQMSGVSSASAGSSAASAGAAPSETPKTGLIYRLHNWCNEDHGDDIVENAQALMSDAAEAISQLKQDLHDAGDGDTWEAAYRRANEALQKCQADLAESERNRREESVPSAGAGAIGEVVGHEAPGRALVQWYDNGLRPIGMKLYARSSERFASADDIIEWVAGQTKVQHCTPAWCLTDVQIRNLKGQFALSATAAIPRNMALVCATCRFPVPDSTVRYCDSGDACPHRISATDRSTNG